MTAINQTIEYKLISTHYGNRVTRRSQVSLMNHINEGLIILDRINATEYAKRAFCLHPLLQADEDLKANSYIVANACDTTVVMLAMEYRNIANAFLSDKMDYTIIGDIKLSPLLEVNDMLVADKVQNRKDYITYHKGTHPRTDHLDMYFDKWLKALNIDHYGYTQLCEAIDESKL